MEVTNEDRITFGGLACLLLFIPLIRGGHHDWASLFVASGIGLIIAAHFLTGIWRGSFSVSWRNMDALVMLALLWTLVSLRRPFAPPDAFVSFLIILSCAGCFFISRHISQKDSLVLPFSVCLISIGGVVAAIGMFQLMNYLPHGWWRPPQFLASTFVNHNHFAAYLELTFPMTVALWMSSSSKPLLRYVLAVLSALMGIGLVFSCSRGGWLSISVASCLVIFFLIYRGKRFQLNWRIISLVLVLFVTAAFLVSRPPIWSRFATLLQVTEDASSQLRLLTWSGTLQLARENLLFGNGLNSFIYTFPYYRPVGLYWLVNHAHNEYLELVAETGVIGLMLVLGFGALVLRRAFRVAQQSQTSWKRALAIGGAIGITSIAVHSVVDFPTRIPAVALQFSAVSGLLTGVTYQMDPSPIRTWNVQIHSAPILFRGFLGVLVVLGVITVAQPMLSLIRADFSYRLARVDEEMGDYENAVDRLRDAVRDSPKRDTYFRWLGMSLTGRSTEKSGLEQMKDYEAAIEAYTEALNLVPFDTRSAYGKGEAAFNVGKFREATPWLQRAVRRDPNNPQYWKKWGELNHYKGNVQETVSAYRRVVELTRPHNFFSEHYDHLDDYSYFVRVGEAARRSGQLGYAETAFKIAKEFEPGDSDVLVNLAVVLLYRMDPEGADVIMSGVHSATSQSKWFAELAQYYLSQKRIEEATTALRQSLALYPSNLLAHHLKIVISKLGSGQFNHEEAMQDLLALNQSPTFATSEGGKRKTVVWELENGSYEKGEKVYQGWALWGNGSIRQQLFVPPGRIKFHVTASGTKSGGLGPTLTLSWQGKKISAEEVKTELWSTYSVNTIVEPGESLIGISFFNDAKDPIAQEDRNLKIEKIVATWEPYNA
jgi:tetratricopeptide (TPR) repeat protein/O-antigen ligase